MRRSLAKSRKETCGKLQNDRFNPKTQLKKMRLTRIVCYKLKTLKQGEPMFQNDLKRKALFDTLDMCVEEAKDSKDRASQA